MTGADRIHDAASLAASLFTRDQDRPADLRTYLLAFYPEATIAPLDHVVLTATPLIARVVHGIWIASCGCGMPGLPRPGCVVWLATPVGWCVRCDNRGVGGGWRPITVPSPAERAQIEAVLLCRPQSETRNWQPGETVADLIRENQEHGCPVPSEEAA